MMKTMAEIVYMSADSTITSIAMQEGEDNDTEFSAVGLGLAPTRYLDNTSLNGLSPKMLVTLKVRLRIRIAIISVVSTVRATERE